MEYLLRNPGFLTRYIITNDNATIHIQGGINAVNGISQVFMVESVMAVIKYDKLRRERKNSDGYVQKDREKSADFSEILNSKVQSTGEAAIEYAATVYGRDMKLSSMQYRTREYHY